MVHRKVLRVKDTEYKIISIPVDFIPVFGSFKLRIGKTVQNEDRYQQQCYFFHIILIVELKYQILTKTTM